MKSIAYILTILLLSTALTFEAEAQQVDLKQRLKELDQEIEEILEKIEDTEQELQNAKLDDHKTIDSLRRAIRNFTEEYDSKMFEQYDATKILRYGAYGSYSMNWHAADFTTFDPLNFPTCLPTEYGAQTGMGPGGGLLFEMPVWERLGANFRAGYTSYAVELSRDESYVFGNNGVGDDAISRHSLDISLGLIHVDLMASYRILDRLQFAVGPRLGVLMGKEFDQQEKLVADSNYTFENNRLIRNDTSAAIPNVNAFQPSLIAHLSYEIPLNRNGTIFVAPEVNYTLPFLDIVEDVSWNVSQFQGSVAIKISPYPTIELISPEQREQERKNDSTRLIARLENVQSDSLKNVREYENRIDSLDLAIKYIKSQQDSLNLALKGVVANFDKVVHVDSKGTETPVKEINVEQFEYSIVTPLLNYIFFEQGSSDIPERYELIEPADRMEFSSKRIATKNTLEVYYNLLNIVGERMSVKPAAVLTIIGCNDGETETEDVSRRRAEAVKYYLQNVWKIPSKNIKLEVRGLPERFTQSTDPKGIEENRRVELYCDDAEVLEPLKAVGETYSIVEPPTIRTYLDVTAGAGVKQWEIEMTDNDEFAITDGGTGELPPYVLWDLQNNQELLPEYDFNISINLFVMDNNDNSVDAHEGVKANVTTIQDKKDAGKPDITIDRYSILLPFDDAGLSGQNKETALSIKEKIQNEYNAEAKYMVKGYTDILGSKEKNIRLAESRARIVAEFLGIPNVVTSGKGISTKYDNSMPEGRFYNRSVDVEIQDTKLK